MTVAPPTAAPVLRDNGILLHVGPHKTGTTAIQGALAAARRELADVGIHYPGGRLAHNRQAAAAFQRSLGWERRTIDRSVWDTLVDHVHHITGKVVLSSEVFCEASADDAQQIVADLDGNRVQVVVTLRPLEKLLPSSWQQYIKSGYRVRYDHWLESVLESREARTVTPSFWIRNNHPALVKRWADCVGPQNVIVVVVDSSKPRSLFDAFEDLLQLPRNTLNADESGPSNRSLSLPEVELLRQFNRRVRQRISHADYYRFVKGGAVLKLVEGRTPGPNEARVTTPAWAIERAREFSKADVADIAGMGVQIVGDVEALAPDNQIPDEPFTEYVASVPTGLAATFMFSLLEASIEIAERGDAASGDSRPSPLLRLRRRIARLRHRAE